MQFSQVIGQADLKEQLIHMVQHNRLSHALLFLGKEGSGALSLARAMAQYTVCEKVNGKRSIGPSPQTIALPSLFDESNEQDAPNEQPETRNKTKVDQFLEKYPEEEVQPETRNQKPVSFPDSCGTCSSCVKASKLIHPDIHFSFPVIPKKSGDKPVSTDYIAEWRQFIEKYPYGNNYDWLQYIDAENKQGNITAHECNEIIRMMSLKSFEAEYKILIMWMPEMLGKEGNKLLKLIEEPPPNSLFIFVAENDSLILPTILSRTQLIKVPRLQAADISAALQLQQNIPLQKADQIAAISDGNYHEALQQLSHADDDWEVLLRDWLNSIAKTGPAAQVKWIDEISKTGREKQKQFLQYFIHLLEHAIRLRMTGITETGSKNDDFALRLNKLCSLEQQEAISFELDNAMYYIERNANAKMLFHALTIKLYHIISNNSIILVQ